MDQIPRAPRRAVHTGIFIPTVAVMLTAVTIGLVDNESLVAIAKRIFYFSLSDFAWLYQALAFLALVVIAGVFFSKSGAIRLGGADAKPLFSFPATFALALTGGIATGVITYAVNEPIIYYGNVYGEIDKQSFAALSGEAAVFSMARSFHNWSFIPYAMYSIVGLMIAFMHFNRKKPFTIAATLYPLFGARVDKPWVGTVISIFAVLAIALGLASSLGAGLALIGSGLETHYGIASNPVLWFVLVAVIGVVFVASAVSGLARGIRFLSALNTYVFYVFLLILLLIGPIAYILSLSSTAFGYWLDNFFLWSFDTKESGGEALVTWWTMYDWAIWIAYAPLMGLFLARISYGRTIREFLIINWILPSVFGMVWFAVWGGTALKWQADGVINLVAVVKAQGAVAGLWAFLQNLPLAALLVPMAIFTLIISFSTAANAMTSTIAAICTRDIRADEESPMWQKVLWGVLICAAAYIMVAFGGGAQGVDGIKFLAAAGGFSVLFVFALIVIAAARLFLSTKALHEEEG